MCGIVRGKKKELDQHIPECFPLPWKREIVLARCINSSYHSHTHTFYLTQKTFRFATVDLTAIVRLSSMISFVRADPVADRPRRTPPHCTGSVSSTPTHAHNQQERVRLLTEASSTVVVLLGSWLADGVRFLIALPRLRVITGENDVRFRVHSNCNERIVRSEQRRAH